jgi:hypothetical protein
MPKEWAEVADTAVKIGFTSIITGFFTYLGVKSSQKSEKNKFMLEHKVKILEQIANDIEIYFSAWISLLNIVSGITKKMPHEQSPISFTSKQISLIKEYDDELVLAWVNRDSAVSKLRLLKADKALKGLAICSSLEYELRNMLMFNRNYYNYSEISEYRTKVNNAKKSFHKSLADFYEQV